MDELASNSAVLPEEGVVPVAQDEEEASYMINGYRRDWYDILRTRDESRGYVPSPTPTPEQPPKRKRRHQKKRAPKRALSPEFGSPNLNQSLRTTSPAPEISSAAMNNVPLSLEAEEHVQQDEDLANTSVDETYKLLTTFEEHWRQKLAKGVQEPVWWMQRDKYFKGLVQRIKDVKEFNIYPVADPNIMKVRCVE